MTDRPPGLDDPAYAAFAWARFRRVLGWMALATVAIIAAALVVLDHFYGPLSWVTVGAVVIGFGGTILLAAALMGLAFLSSGSGHDAAVDDFASTQQDRRRP
jgi:hypothetical protein